MPVPTDITAGTISISGSTVTGVGTSFMASDIRQGDLFIWIEGGAGQWSPIVQTVTSNTVLTLAEPWTGPTISGARYRLRYQWDSSRVSAQSRQLIEMLDNGNVLALAGLTGPGVPVFDGPHSMTVRSVESFINGVAYNVQVDTLADRAAYDGQAQGFAVLVANIGDGRSAVYSKASNSSGDWTDAAYVTGATGEPGPFTELTFGDVTTVPYGTPASVDVVAVDSETVRLDFSIPAGQDGSGTGDVVGPASSLDGQEAIFSATTGKLLRSAGFSAFMNSVSPIVVNMHFETLMGVGWTSSDPGNIVSTTTTSAVVTTTDQIPITSVTGFSVGMLICYVATNGEYYSASITQINGNTLRINQNVRSPIASGGAVYNFYRDDAHPNAHGFACLVDDAIRQMRNTRTLIAFNSSETQWTAVGTVTLTVESIAFYGNPGSTIVGMRGLRVQGTPANNGVISASSSLLGGTFESEVVLNPGTRDGGFSGAVIVEIIATYSDGTSSTVASRNTSGFGNAVQNVVLRYRVPRGTSVRVRVTNLQSGPWTYYVGSVKHFRIDNRIRAFNKGKHVVFGDSWAAGGDFVNRLITRLPNATIVNKGISGDTTTNMASRFDADVAVENPNYVWVLGGTNDVYAQTPVNTYQKNIDSVISAIQRIAALPVVFDVSVCSNIYAPAPGPRLDFSRQYAIGSFFSDGISPSSDSQSGSYTPSFSGSIGNGTLTGTWSKIGKQVTNTVNFVAGSTTNFGSGVFTFGLSEAAVSSPGGFGVFGLDPGVSVRAGMTRPSTTTNVSIIDINTLNNWSPTVPMTWGAGDSLNFTVIFQSAQ